MANQAKALLSRFWTWIAALDSSLEDYDRIRFGGTDAEIAALRQRIEVLEKAASHSHA